MHQQPFASGPIDITGSTERGLPLTLRHSLRLIERHQFGSCLAQLLVDDVEFGMLTPLVTAGLAVVINAFRKWVTNGSPDPA